MIIEKFFIYNIYEGRNEKGKRFYLNGTISSGHNILPKIGTSNITIIEGSVDKLFYYSYADFTIKYREWVVSSSSNSSRSKWYMGIFHTGYMTDCMTANVEEYLQRPAL